jgi:acylphosphatase
MSDELVRQRFRVEGRVQGVGFRAWAARQARELSLAGYVRNASDGSVELEAEGSREALRHLEAGLHEGPPFARVRAVTPLETTGRPLPRQFLIDG